MTLRVRSANPASTRPRDATEGRGCLWDHQPIGTKSKVACRAEMRGMDTRVRTIIQLMSKLSEGDLSLCLISRNVNLSPSRLRQLFKTENRPLSYAISPTPANAERGGVVTEGVS